ncbi:MAG: hypothetical protein JWM53_5815 [bacterium]|jgi:hypothetical protein|nr:hypothetical protein [bacterium]
MDQRRFTRESLIEAAVQVMRDVAGLVDPTDGAVGLGDEGAGDLFFAAAGDQLDDLQARVRSAGATNIRDIVVIGEEFCPS